MTLATLVLTLYSEDAAAADCGWTSASFGFGHQLAYVVQSGLALLAGTNWLLDAVLLPRAAEQIARQERLRLPAW